MITPWKFIIGAGLALVIAPFNPVARAELLVYEPFTCEVGSGIKEFAGSGWGGGWQSPETFTIELGSLPFDGLLTEGNHLSAQGADARRPFEGNVLPSGVLWISMLLANPKAEESFVSINPTEYNVGLEFGARYSKNWVVYSAVGEPSEVDSHIPITEPLFVVMRLEFDAGDTRSNEKASIWFNPTPGTTDLDPETAAAVLENVGNWGDDPVWGMGMKGDLEADEIRIGTSFADVAPPAK